MATQRDFDALADDFMSKARQEEFPEGLAQNVISVARGPASGAIAYSTWYRWFHALPGDEISKLTLSDIHALFVSSAEAWEQARTAAGDLASLMLAPENLQRASEIAAGADWEQVRARALENVEPAKQPVVGALLDAPLSLAAHAQFPQLQVETAKSHAEAVFAHAQLLAEIETGGAAAMAKRRRRGARGYHNAVAGGWAIGYTAVAVLCGVGSMPFAAGAAGASALYCAGVAFEVW